MKPFDDRLPQEQDPQYEELITVLQHANLGPMLVDPAQRAQILSRARARLIQTDSEVSLIEDIPVAEMQSRGVFPSKPKAQVVNQHERGRLVQLLNVLAAVLVIAALIGSFLIILRSSFIEGTGGIPTATFSSNTASRAFPTLTLSTNAASPGSTVTVILTHFSPSTRAVLTHDIQEPIVINGSSSITTNAQGSATFPLIIDTTWRPGFHLIVAEDVTSRSTASANLQIIGEGIANPAYLLIDTTPLAMEADVVGTNTIRSFTLANNGGGSISWSANSDASWLLATPSQGVFSQQEAISLAVQRIGLKPGDYHGSLTISSNVSPPEHVDVEMTVRPLPANAGPVLAVTPALLSFTAINGQQNNMHQELTISNPGSRPLDWSLAPIQGLACNWLGATQSTVIVPPGATASLTVDVQSQCLLPGTYTGTLTFTANSTIDSSQAVNVSVVVQPHCGLVTSTGFLAFTIVAGQNTLANQSLSLNATASCAGIPTPWTSSSTASWLSITPGNGEINANDNTLVSASVNAGGLAPSKKPYYADLSFVSGQSTLKVMAQLTVQTAPPLSSPIMSASPLSLNFSNIQGQPTPTGQVVTITNNGHSALSWHPTPNQLSSSWLAASPSGGVIAPGQSEQATININTVVNGEQLTPGNYIGQIILNGMDTKGNAAPGSPQTVIVNLVVQPPCTLLPPSSSALSFSAVQGVSGNPAPQTIMFTGWGNCVWPLSWKAGVMPTANWLMLTPSSGTIGGTGQSGSVGVGANTTGLVAGKYTATVTIVASDTSGAAVQGSRQTFTVTLTIVPSCVFLSPSPGSLAFTVPQGNSPSSVKTVILSEIGTCARPVTWTASTNGLKPWVVLSTTSGTDSGSGSTIGVSIDPTGFPPGSYSYPGIIMITATDSTGATILGSGQTINLQLTVTS